MNEKLTSSGAVPTMGSKREITEDQIDKCAISGIAGLPWLHGQYECMGENPPHLVRLVRTAFPDDETTVLIVVQRMVRFMDDQVALEARRHELFGTREKEQ